MKLYLVRVGALTYRDLQPSSCDAILAAMSRYPGAIRISARLAP